MTYWPEPKTKREMLADVTREHGMPEKSRLPQKNTLDYTMPDGTRRIRLHHTDVLTIHPNGAMDINTGGWNTPTTRDRLTGYLPAGYRVSTMKGQAYLQTPKGSFPFNRKAHIGPRGAVKPDMKEGKLDKRKRLIDGFMNHIKINGLPTANESGGDPWIFNESQVDESVMMDWLKSKYFTRTFFVLAMRYARMPETGIAMFLSDIDRKGGKLDRFHTGRIRRYIRSRLGMAT